MHEGERTLKRELKIFDPDDPRTEIALVNTFTEGWPYSRPIDEALIQHWRTLDRFQREHMLTAWEDRRPVAFIHGEVASDDVAHIAILAVRPGQAEAGTWLLEQWHGALAGKGVTQCRGPTARAGAFYGGFVIGLEPYPPSWATAAVESFLRAGYRMGPPDLIMVCDLSQEVKQDPVPQDYEVIEVEPASEYEAKVFGYHAVRNGQKAAHCYARLYPALTSPAGLPVGQIGNVTTEPEHRNRGLARAMVQMSLRRLAGMGAGEALIATGLENRPALRAYERAGFQRRHLLTDWICDLGEG